MYSLFFYKDDYIENPRDTEGSNKVIRLWYDERVRYANEDIPDDQCMRLVAERLMVRHLLGIDALDMAYMAKTSQSRPFGVNTPMLAELLMPGTFFAMALVPLSPPGTHGRPVVARLYCVAGLANRHILLLEGMDEASLQGCSWFVAGVPQSDLEKGVHGRSWLLAANLLARIVAKRDVKTARNLAKSYIVTGDVSNGAIRRVEMLRKPELAKQFDNFKWIIPKENDMDIPKRKIEKPATLEEAYQLIESMRSTATKSFFRFLREGNLAGLKEQYRIGADLFAREAGTDLTCLEVVANEKAKLYAAKTISKTASDKEIASEVAKVDPESLKKCIRERIAVFDDVVQWLRQQGVDSSIMFYLMAINGDEVGIDRSREYCSINACDEHGLTAVDLALVEGKFDVVRLLHRYGGVPNTRLGANPRLAQAINRFCDPFDDWGADIKLIVAAIEAGFPHNTRVRIPSHHGAHLDEYCSLFACAVQCANYDVLEACLKNGADVNEVLSWNIKQPRPWGEEDVSVKEGTPWAILSSGMDIKEDKRQKFRALLQQYGAKIDGEALDAMPTSSMRS